MASPNLKKRIIDLLSKGFATTGYYGLPDLVANAGLVDDIYQESDYTPAERAALMTWFGKHPINVIGEYPRSPEHIPAVVVQRVRDGEHTRGPLGHAFGPDYTADTDEDAVLVWGVRANESFKISIWAINSSDMRDAIYLAVRELLLRGRAYCENNTSGIDMVLFTGGRDTQIDIGTLEKPLIIYQGELTLEAKTRTRWKETKPKATGLLGKSNYVRWLDES